MALDGTLLRQIRHELESCLIGARIDKIHQFSREEMILCCVCRSQPKTVPVPLSFIFLLVRTVLVFI